MLGCRMPLLDAALEVFAAVARRAEGRAVPVGGRVGEAGWGLGFFFETRLCMLRCTKKGPEPSIFNSIMFGLCAKLRWDVGGKEGARLVSEQLFERASNDSPVAWPCLCYFPWLIWSNFSGFQRPTDHTLVSETCRQNCILGV